MSHSPKYGNYEQSLEARYSNYFQVGHNAFEFILDFGQLSQDDGAPRVNLRVVTNPVYAKSLLDTLSQAVDAYEHSFGTIPIAAGEDEKR